tara:strand:- start:2406 stop:3248 length:843 start_codon:yes stop_codon:yes gene_type:complete
LLIESSELLKLYKNNIWLKNTIILDASWYLPNLKRNAHQEFNNAHIPGAIYFNIDEICDPISNLPHTIPTKKQFEYYMQELGIKNNSNIIVYSMDGIGTSPRAWWLFKLYNHKNISILNGGLKAWRDIKGPIINTASKITKSKYVACEINKNIIASYEEIKKIYNSRNHQIIDARSAGRFSGIEEEPRPGLQKGHIPNSINIPFNLLIDNQGYLIKKDKILNLLNKNNFDFKKISVSSCGSGVTACVLAFALEFLGKKEWKVYDGSWSEWGHQDNKLIEQ